MTSPRGEMTSLGREVTSGRREVTSGCGEVTSERREVSSGHGEATSGPGNRAAASSVPGKTFHPVFWYERAIFCRSAEMSSRPERLCPEAALVGRPCARTSAPLLLVRTCDFSQDTEAAFGYGEDLRPVSPGRACDTYARFFLVRTCDFSDVPRFPSGAPGVSQALPAGSRARRRGWTRVKSSSMICMYS